MKKKIRLRQVIEHVVDDFDKTKRTNFLKTIEKVQMQTYDNIDKTHTHYKVYRWALSSASTIPLLFIMYNINKDFVENTFFHFYVQIG